MLTAYAKTDRDDLTAADRKALPRLDDRFRNNMTIVAPINRTECI